MLIRAERKGAIMAVNTVEKKENKTKELEQWMQMASPFAIHEGEIMVDEKAEEYGHYIELDPFQTEIVKSVNALLFATRQLIKKYLIRQGVKVKDKLLDKVNWSIRVKRVVSWRVPR